MATSSGYDVTLAATLPGTADSRGQYTVLAYGTDNAGVNSPLTQVGSVGRISQP